MIKVLNYGSGNIKAITNIYSRLNIPCDVATRKEDLSSASKIILPGVGAFDQSMSLLRNSGMLETANSLVIDHGIPVLGVCVGMQMMAKSSEEGQSAGLGWIDGVVKRIDISKLNHKPKLPHMGWNTISVKTRHSILEGIEMKKGFYFLHSYCFTCNNEDNVLATSFYGQEFASAVFSNNIFGFQFHPEKSHGNGIRIFKNFGEI